MTFTYTPAAADDITRVRFHLADTDEDTANFSDEEITFQISETGTWQKATIACIEAMIAKLSTAPDFKADWLEIDKAETLKGWQSLLVDKQATLGTRRVTVSSKGVYRPDSYQTSGDW